MSRRTIGYHAVKTTYGTWLPGDDRGSWSSAWDEQRGYVQPHTLHCGDPIRRQIAVKKMSQAPVRLTAEMIEVVAQTLSTCVDGSCWQIAAASIEPTHLHLLITYNPNDIDKTLKWLTQQMTKAIHFRTTHKGPVWTRGWWRSFIFEEDHWRRTMRYIERHNQRRGVGPRPYAFITPWEPPP